MRRLGIVGIFIMLFTSCEEKSESTDTSVTIVSSDEQSLTFSVNPGVNQDVGAPATASITGTFVQFPAGTFSETIQITLRRANPGPRPT